MGKLIEPEENIAFFAFDIIYLNKRNLLDVSLPIRKQLLEQHFKERGIINIVTGRAFDMTEKNFEKDVEGYFDEAIKEGYEGLIIKSMDPEKTYYDTKGRTQWIKVSSRILSTLA
jgi:ATP-dependent DNA ligase